MSGTTDISDIDLHAFIDGALEADLARALAARIEADPALAARVAAFRGDKDMLKRIYAPLAERPIPQEWLALAQNAKPQPAIAWRLYGSIAAVLVLMLAGTFAYWQTRPQPTGEIVGAALAARAQGMSETPMNEADAAQYDAALSKAVALKVKVPDLKRLGYRLAGMRLYPNASGTGAAELLYRDGGNRLFTLYLRHSDGMARFDQFQRAGLRVCIWQDDQLGMVMAGNVTTASMQRLASLAYTGLTS